MSISRVNTLKMTGMNSGLDTESIVEALTLNTKNKIDANNKKITKLSWKQEAYRDVISKITNFKNSYFDSLKSSSYLLSKNMFSEYKKTITANGSEVTKGLSVTTSTNSNAGTHTLKLDQLAENSNIEGSKLESSSFKLDIDDAMAVYDDNRTGTTPAGYAFSLNFTVGSKNETIEFSGADKAALLSDLNTKLSDTFGESTVGNKYIQAKENTDGDLEFDLTGNVDAVIKESSGYFGINSEAYTVGLTPSNAVSGTNSVIIEIGGAVKQVDFDLVNSSYFKDLDKSTDIAVSSEYNKLKEAAYRKEYGVADGTTVTESALSRFEFTAVSAAAAHNAAIIKDKLNEAYASEDITFDLSNDNKLSAKNTTTSEAVAFKFTSINGGTLGVAGNSITNSLSSSTTLASLGIEGVGSDGNYSMQINGTTIKVANTATIKDLMSTVNGSGAGVTMSFSVLTGKISLESNEYGTASKISITSSEFTKSLGITATDDGSETTVSNGSNAIINVDGKQVINNSNSISVDGSTYTFDDDAEIGTEYTVGLTKSYDNAKSVIKKFVEDYNKLIDDVYDYTTTKPAKSSNKATYEPLTDEEKEEMSETEIEKWEEKAKEGILYNDSDINSVMSKLRSTLYESISLSDGSKFSLYDMGITTSSDYTAHGKLEIDETKLNKAFTEHGEDIMELFTNKTTGVMTKFDNVLTGAVKSTGARSSKGSLVQIAGLATGTSSSDNRLYDEMERLGKVVDKYINYYESRQDYYWSVYSNLETQMGNLNGQSSYISQLMNM